ncbi:hypothetical protein ACHAWF_006115 [Thalassiosira exigua]
MTEPKGEANGATDASTAMARRRCPGRRRRDRAASAAARATAKAARRGAGPDRETPPGIPSPSTPRAERLGPSIPSGAKRPASALGGVGIGIGRRARRRRTRAATTTPAPPAVLAPATPLPLAACRPASLLAVLLAASLLPRGTFSLRWLALSEGGAGSSGQRCSGGSIGRCLVNRNNGRRLIDQQSEKILSSWLATASDTEVDFAPCEEAKGANAVEGKGPSALWKDVAASLRRSIRSADTASVLNGEEGEDWSLDSIWGEVPRGGADADEARHAGLMNLGNTCYLNAQLQCAYHVPYLRKLVLEAEDRVVEKEVEVEVEVEVEEGEEEKKEEAKEGDAEEEKKASDIEVAVEAVDSAEPECDDDDAQITDAGDDAAKREDRPHPLLDKSTGDDPESNAQAEETTPPPRKTVVRKEVRKEVREEVVPLSLALRALQRTFATLDETSSSGTTHVLCRTLGINPYVQQDGQEFWKLFVPEVDFEELSGLYGGYFEDYVREIVPELEDEYESGGEEKKQEEDDVTPRKLARQASERVRKEPFLDLSIPVLEGTSGSVEATLRDTFTQPEVLRVSEGNGWRPSKGAEKVDAQKGSSLVRDGLPSLLQLHLKRFKYDWETGETSKINDRCSFPLELDLSEIMSDEHAGEIDDVIYDLQSIVIHKGEYGSGESLSTSPHPSGFCITVPISHVGKLVGHYYSYARPDIRQDKWYRFDDELVTPVDYADVVADAYGGSRRMRNKRPKVEGIDGLDLPAKQRQGIFRRLLSIFGIFRRIAMIGSGSSGGGCGFGYGGRTSSAYMLQYVRRSDIPRLYLDMKEHEQ